MPHRRAARAESRALGLLEEQGADQVLPVHVDKLAANLGIIVRRDHFGSEDISGLLLREPGSVPVIGVNADNAKTRQRFTVAHELGHFLLHDGKELILDRAVRVNFRDAASSLANDVEEMEANAFAASLLMPPHLIAREVETIVQGRQCSDDELVDRLTGRFKVSRSAMEFRLINLGVLTPS